MKSLLLAFLPLDVCPVGRFCSLLMATLAVVLSAGNVDAQSGMTWTMTTSPLNGFTEQVFSFDATALDTLESADIVLNIQGGNNSNNWASDLLIAIVDPAGNGVEWGGYNLTTFGMGYTAITDWPASWNSGAESGSPWSITVDLSAGQLSGTGMWTVRLSNGSDIGNANMTYDLSMYLPEMSADGAGCTDAAACNYSAAALIDDGTCAFNPFGDCACTQTVTALETLGGGISGTPLTLNGSGALTYVEVALDFTGTGTEWPADMMIELTSPQGSCISFGGIDTLGCNSRGDWTLWPVNWRHPYSGTYSATLDLTAAGLPGDGDWSVNISNGNSLGAAVTYDVSLTFYSICAGGVIAGCTDASACNYSAVAELDNGLCDMLDACGICGGDNSSCSGCTYEYACNYDPEALVDDGSCNLIEDLVVGCCSYSAVINEAISGNQSTTLDLPASAIGALGNFDISVDFQATGSMRNWASDLYISLIDPNGTCIYFGGNEKTESDDSSPYLAANNCTELTGQGWPDGWDTNVAGTYSAQIDFSASGLAGIGIWELGLHNGDINSSPAEFSALTWNVDGLCNVEGCTDTAACNFTPNITLANEDLCVYAVGCETCNPDGTVDGNDEDADGLCDADDACSDTTAVNYNTLDNAACLYAGCTNACAGNFNPDAVADDGSCDPVPGCMDAVACNYDACADVDAGCTYPDACGICGGPGAIYACGCTELPDGACDCAGNVPDACGVCGGTGSDLDGDGICDSEEILGCTYPGACNLDAAATQDDGSCLFPETGYGCDGACLADDDEDGICDAFEVPGCMQADADNFHPAATDDDGTCYFNPCDDSCPADVNEDGLIGVQDVLTVLSQFDSACP